jgi:hypothetical protein
MTLDKPLFIAAATSLAIASTPVGATGAGAGGARQAVQQPSRATQMAPLKGDLRPLNTGTARAAQPRLAMPPTSVETLTKKFYEFASKAKSHEHMTKSAPNIAEQCASKSYNVQQQAAAGCTASDTVAACTDKLMKHCIANFSDVATLPGVGVGTMRGSQGGGQIGFSTKQYLQLSQTTAAEARALGVLLNQYANQVEQNAKALIP